VWSTELTPSCSLVIRTFLSATTSLVVFSSALWTSLSTQAGTSVVSCQGPEESVSGGTARSSLLHSHTPTDRMPTEAQPLTQTFPARPCRVSGIPTHRDTAQTGDTLG
jgi:hypothetical protein